MISTYHNSYCSNNPDVSNDIRKTLKSSYEIHAKEPIHIIRRPKNAEHFYVSDDNFTSYAGVLYEHYYDNLTN